jgi:chemotaxis protein CheZ
MSAVAQLNADSDDLESLFDSIVAENTASPAIAANSTTADGAPAAAGADEVINRIGKMTRSLHEGLRALGYDKVLEAAAAKMPDTRDRLSYVVSMTEQAAQRALNAIEAAKPIQDELASGAAALDGRWNALFTAQPGADEFKSLVEQTREFLRQVPARARATNAQLNEIMMAQDFQDLTGQVIKKITDVVHQLENQMLSLLIENAPPQKREDAGGLLNGPVIDAAGRTDVVTSQQKVDELLDSLGF